VRKPPLSDYRQLTLALTEAVCAYVADAPGVPFALFGHSLGSLLAFGVARQLRRCSAAQPCCLLCSSATAPQIAMPYHSEPPPQDWTIVELGAYLRSIGGTPETVLRNPDYLHRLLPRMQVDLAVRASYTYAQEAPLEYPLAVFGGQHDTGVSAADLAAWEEQTNAYFTLYRFPGGHFFPHDRETRGPFLRTLSLEVMRWLEDTSTGQMIELLHRGGNL
jgi:surfactin synthase thioesterase subunit